MLGRFVPYGVSFHYLVVFAEVYQLTSRLHFAPRASWTPLTPSSYQAMLCKRRGAVTHRYRRNQQCPDLVAYPTPHDSHARPDRSTGVSCWVC